jgi:hypothetical protein
MTDDLYDKLERLATLRDRGILSDEEFAAQKAKLLAAGSSTPAAAQPSGPPARQPGPDTITPRPQAERASAPPTPASLPKEQAPPRKSTVGSVAFLAILAILLPCGGLIVYGNHETEKAALEAEAQAARNREAALADQLAREREIRETPRVALTVSRCDDSCSGLFEACTFVECAAQNVGEVSVEGTVDVVAGETIVRREILLGAGQTDRLSAKFKGVAAKRCECRTGELHRFVHD